MYRQSLQLLAVLVGLRGAFAAPSQVADKLTGQEPSVVEHNAVTTQLWEGYDYCQGLRTLVPSTPGIASARPSELRIFRSNDQAWRHMDAA